MSTINNRTFQQAADQKLSDGLAKHASSIASIVVSNTPYKPADLISTVETRITAADTTQSTRATWQSAVQAERDARARTQALVSGLKQTLQVMFAGSVDTLADFGLTPRKTRVISPETKVLAAAKARATRAARHTMGKNQKKDIKGVISTPATAPSTAPAPMPVPVTTTAPVITSKQS
jgi:hypothetical protein